MKRYIKLMNGKIFDTEKDIIDFDLVMFKTNDGHSYSYDYIKNESENIEDLLDK